MIARPTDVVAAAALAGPYRAGGVDLLRTGAPPAAVDLSGLTDLRAITPTGDGLRIGALTTLADLAANPDVRTRHPALAQAAAAIATPLVRGTATVGGNLLQARCACAGVDCPYRTTRRDRAVCFDTAACAAPHPSSLATVLACLGGVAHRVARPVVPVAELTGDGLLTAVHVPDRWPGERSRYLRLTTRAGGGWPLVEVAVRVSDTPANRIRVTAGGVAPTPLRLPAVEELVDATPQARGHAVRRGANPPPGAAYKVTALSTLIEDALAGTHHLDSAQPEPDAAAWRAR
jgi:xanthine dehydrogenase YagS FAD-binding subunit